MSQQEFMPESQQAREEAQDNEEVTIQSYSQYRTSDMPKRDHPADFENSIPPYSYPAQERQQQKSSEAQANTRQQETGTYQQNPHIAQPSRIEEQLERAGRRFYAKQQRRFERARNGQRSYVPPQASRRRAAGRAPGWVIVLLIAVGFLVLLPLLLKLLLALFAVLLVLALGAIFAIILVLFITAIVFKNRWQRSRWRYGPPLRHGRMRYTRWRR
ncbi:hypothetical protein [Dictyobacter arantiisoli]|uniref:Uncharacterized protein n=1 Tax=Dictyobacter arantiisoli TaxID=2014874 RepID=A0A5A5TDJ0_9CHLR|nr:hypothetical protein [Dictyobacter arantiisoli]GCF09246.1 hypothetical protein KDI_28100 [Dictyobacter arantiisoli]